MGMLLRRKSRMFMSLRFNVHYKFIWMIMPGHCPFFGNYLQEISRNSFQKSRKNLGKNESFFLEMGNTSSLKPLSLSSPEENTPKTSMSNALLEADRLKVSDEGKLLLVSWQQETPEGRSQMCDRVDQLP